MILSTRKPSVNLQPTVHVWAVAPTYPLCQQFWRDLKARFPQDLDPDFKDGKLVLEAAGSEIIWEMKSADNPDSLVGSGIDILILIEAGLISDYAFYVSLRPRLTSPGRLGMGILNGTPKGRGTYFEEMFLKGQDPNEPDYWSHSAPTHINPYVSKKELEDAKKDMPERWYRQEHLAEWLSGEGAVFRNVRNNIVAPREDYDWVKPIMIGVDWGRTQDFTVFTAVDATWRVVGFDRMNQVDWDVQVDRLAGFCSKFNPQLVQLESNAQGDPMFRALEKDSRFKWPLKPFHTTAQSKALIVRDLVIAIETGQMTYPDLPIMLNELMAFEFTTTAFGNIRYSAGGKWHDDCVISLALAHNAHGGLKTDDVVARATTAQVNKFKMHNPYMIPSGF